MTLEESLTRGEKDTKPSRRIIYGGQRRGLSSGPETFLASGRKRAKLGPADWFAEARGGRVPTREKMEAVS